MSKPKTLDELLAALDYNTEKKINSRRGELMKPDVLMYDIETTLLSFWGFRMGEQRVNHGQLQGGYFSRSHIICISYSWDFGKTVHTLDWGTSEADEKQMIIDFDQLINEADVVIGKNSDRFDNKHINAHRMWNDLPGMPYWTKHTDDLEKQMRKHFDLPSQSLDYISNQLGFGGKDKMSFEDWVAINRMRLIDLMGSVVGNEMTLTLFGKKLHDVVKEGEKATAKMIKYNKKDVKDTGRLWKHLEKHFIPKVKANVFLETGPTACEGCGSTEVRSLGNRYSGKTYYKSVVCLKCGVTSRHPVKKGK